jgi:hypothetical protein
VKQLRHPPHAKVAFDASSAPEAGCWRARLWTLRWRRLPTWWGRSEGGAS